MTSLLITGATGFVGSAIVKQCQAERWDVRTTGRSSHPSHDFPNYTKADLLNPATIYPLLDGVESVVHAAGLAHQFGKPQDMLPFKAINTDGTALMVQAAASVGVKHFVLISSVSVYGLSDRNSCNENAPCHPQTPYGQSKYEAELRAMEVAKETDMRLTILRLATVYGEGDPGNIARLMRTIDRKRFIWIGKGSNYKSLIHRDDVARACLAVLGSQGKGINIYNVSAEPCTMREIVEELAYLLERRIPSWQIPASLALALTRLAAHLFRKRGRLGTLHATVQKWLENDVYDASKFYQTFSVQAQINLAEGLRREVAWYRNQKR